MVFIEKQLFYEQQQQKEALEEPLYDFVIFDADSTLATIEGIDELAKRKGVADKTKHLTTQAMNGDIPFDVAYFQRFNIIQPTFEDAVAIGHIYQQHITPGAKEVIQSLVRNNTIPLVVSGGFNPSLRMLTQAIGIPDHHVFANEIFNQQEELDLYQNTPYELWRPDGKVRFISQFLLEYEHLFQRKPNIAVVGDGMSDFEAGQLANIFICFAGIEARPKVIAKTNPEYIIWEHDLRCVLPYLC